ncbi:epoxyqueuosine reductase QueH [Clostridia bacterium]|nr:epoxyqueuosine reductase QueH [Clostridia bacterium]
MNEKQAYQKMTNEVIENNRKKGIRPKLLLHCCCAPCASVPLVDWSNDFDIAAYYYNPNIYPEKEAVARAEELKRFVASYPFNNRPKVIIADYTPEVYFDMVRGLENEPERGLRCEVCFELRFTQTAELAKQLHYDYFTTTLSISPYKNASLLHQLGLNIQERIGVQYLPCDLKKNNGMKRSVELSKEYALYRQDYCGCVYSKNEMLERKKRMKIEEGKNEKTDIV